MNELRFRQIHLDYHTSEKIPVVGDTFDPEEFVQTLLDAHVNSITCFARCHHGMMYYDSLTFPHLVHPGLQEKNLLMKQIEACHAHNIKVPIYTTIQWDYHISKIHPEWCCLTPEGGLVDFCESDSSHIYEPGFYRTLCVNSPYRTYLKEHIKDIYDVIGEAHVDGFFLDIVNVVDCSCHHCVSDMEKKGFNPENKSERIEYARMMIAEFKKDFSAYIRSFKEDVSIFYNAGHVNHQSVDASDAYSHWELESLPSGIWGYSHFTNTVRYARTTGKDLLAQTGKFHTMWGDFHSLKNKTALEYECLRMLAYNAKCLVGDQLNPNGRLSPEVYELIGSVYSKIEEREKWCKSADPIVELAVFTPESLHSIAGCGGIVPDEVNGCCTMLDELGYLFDIVEERTDWSKYKLVILPDTVRCNERLKEKVTSYIKSGGYVLATGDSTLDWDQDSFTIADFGIKYVGKEDRWPSFIMPNEMIGKNLPKTEHVMYLQGNKIETAGASVILGSVMPYFSRTWKHFCSHRHTPSSSEIGTPAGVKTDSTIYFSHPIFSIYDKLHPTWCKEIVKDALRQLIPEQVVQTDGPTSMLTTMNRQSAENRYILHVLHYIPIKNSQELYTIEDVINLYNVKFSLLIQEKVESVRFVPEGNDVAYSINNGRLEFVIPEIKGHVMVEIQYKREKA